MGRGGYLFSGVGQSFVRLVRWGVLALALSQGGAQQFILAAVRLQRSLRGVVSMGWRGDGCDRGPCMSAIISVCLRPLSAVCHRSLSFALNAVLFSQMVLWGGSLALSFCLSDPCVALVQHSGFVGSSASAVLWEGGRVTFSEE